jgi:hypothetical protein
MQRNVRHCLEAIWYQNRNTIKFDTMIVLATTEAAPVTIRIDLVTKQTAPVTLDTEPVTTADRLIWSRK